MRDREQIFSDFLSELRQREKEESRTHREKVCHSVSSEFLSAFVRIEPVFCSFNAVRNTDKTHTSCSFSAVLYMFIIQSK